MIAHEQFDRLLVRYRHQQVTTAEALRLGQGIIERVADDSEARVMFDRLIAHINTVRPLKHARSIPKELRDQAVTGRTARQAAAFLADRGYSVSPRTIEEWPKPTLLTQEEN